MAKLSLSKTYQSLKTQVSKQKSLSELLTESRLKSYQSQYKALTYLYGLSETDDSVLEQLAALANEQELIKKFQDIRSGAIVNRTENRAATHQQSRDPKSSYYQNEVIRSLDFAERIRKKDYLSVSGKHFKDIVQIGIGGSDLGPHACQLALEGCCDSQYTPQFISSLDPVNAEQVLSKISLDESLFIVVSKSGSTIETAENLSYLEAECKEQGHSWESFRKNIVVISRKGSLLDKKDLAETHFYMEASIGGRYSVTSPVGTLLLGLCFGKEAVISFLEGAHDMDTNAEEETLTENLSLLAASIQLWESVFLGYDSSAVIPYSHSLSRFPAHLQQLHCESLGKSCTQDGDPIDYASGDLIFGEEGPNAQHSFFQLLHQGTKKIPVQFIGFRQSKSQKPQGQKQEEQLKMSIAAQMMALALGKKNNDLAHHFPGNRPSTLILGEDLSPYTLGALLAFYENKVIFHALFLDINPFDQVGVELGKDLIKRLADQQEDGTLLDTLFQALK